MNSSTVLVTGGAGMIGCNLVKALRKRGNKVVVVDNLWRGSLKNLTDSRGKPVID
jgi:nucleoside-diphosphate-sugar epimerase